MHTVQASEGLNGPGLGANLIREPLDCDGLRFPDGMKVRYRALNMPQYVVFPCVHQTLHVRKILEWHCTA